MNVKKMFAATAGVLLTATAVVPASIVGAASYGAELQGAYEYAFSKGITTMTSIDNANMYGELTRGQLAKMIANWAEQEKGVKADETQVCSFTDANRAEGDLATYVKKACQMGLMGQGITAFRPNDKVTRGEFGTTLSRALWGNKFDTTETPFYKNHLVALQDAGIMKQISTPNQMEIRGYVMLMLQRSTETITKGDALCKDPVVVLACTLGSANCPSACKTTEGVNNTGNTNTFSGVKAGDLSIALNATNGTTSIPNDGVVKVAELTLTSSQDVQLQSLNVTRVGLSNNEGLKVWIEKDGRRISSSSSFFGDSKANIVFNGGYVVKKNEKLDLVISLDKAKVAAGSELAFRISDVASSAQNTTVSPDTTGIYRTTTYAVTSLSFVSLNNTARTYNISKDSAFSFGEFKLQNDSAASMEKNINIKTITFRVDGAGIENLNNFKLLRNGKELNTTYTVNGKDVTFTINDQLDSGKSAVYKVIATPTNIESENGDEYTFKIRRAEDVIAEELGQNAVGYRVSIKNINHVENGLGKTTIKGGTITLVRDANFPSVVNADWGYSDVTIAKGTITLNQATKFEKGLVIERSATSATNLEQALRRVAVVIGGRTYQATKIEADKIIIDSEVYLDKGAHAVEVLASIASIQTAGITNFELKNISKDTFLGGRYLNSDETGFTPAHMVGTLRVAKVNIQAQKVGFKKVGPNEDVKLVAGNTDEKVIFVGELTNSADKTLEISQVTLLPVDVAGVAANVKLSDVSLHLADGSASSTVAITNGNTGTIDSITTTIEPGKTLKFELRGVNNADLVATNKYRFNVVAKGTLEGNQVSTTALKTAYVEINAAATTTVVGNTTTKNMVVLPGVATEVASFNYNVKNDSIDLTEVKFASNIAAGQLDTVTISFGDITPAVDEIISDGAHTTVKFANLVTLPAKNYTVKVFATFAESAIDTTNAGAGTDQTAKTFTSVEFFNGADSKGQGTVNYSHFVAKAFPILAVKEKNTNSGNERLDLNVTKSSDDYKVVINEITANPGTFTKVSGTAGNFENIELNKTTAEVARSTVARTAVQKVKFSVTDDYGNVAVYADVDASNIADFASLSL